MDDRHAVIVAGSRAGKTPFDDMLVDRAVIFNYDGAIFYLPRNRKLGSPVEYKKLPFTWLDVRAMESRKMHLEHGDPMADWWFKKHFHPPWHTVEFKMQDGQTHKIYNWVADQPDADFLREQLQQALDEIRVAARAFGTQS